MLQGPVKQLSFVAVAVLIVLLTGSIGGFKNTVCAQGNMIIYPAKGQSEQTMDKDKYECYAWAKKETGFDPMKAGSTTQTPPPGQGPGGERVQGAARGAAVGAVAGAIAGDAGKGAGAGAAGGAMIGGAKKRNAQRQAAQAQQQKSAAVASQQSTYNRAFGACMEGRGYTIK